jgi:hypothetical protein
VSVTPTCSQTRRRFAAAAVAAYRRGDVPGDVNIAHGHWATVTPPAGSHRRPTEGATWLLRMTSSWTLAPATWLAAYLACLLLVIWSFLDEHGLHPPPHQLQLTSPCLATASDTPRLPMPCPTPCRSLSRASLRWRCWSHRAARLSYRRTRDSAKSASL